MFVSFLFKGIILVSFVIVVVLVIGALIVSAVSGALAGFFSYFFGDESSGPGDGDDWD